MYEDLEEIVLNKPIKEATYLDYCKGTRRQRSLKEMKEASLDTLKEHLKNDELAEMAFNALKDCQEGYMRICRIWPSVDEPREGWTYVFAAGLPLFLNRPEEWYYTTNIKNIDWAGKVFTTKNSVYTFEFIDYNKEYHVTDSDI